MSHSRNYVALRRFSLAAFLWASAFGLLSALWASGVEVGVDLLSPTIVDRFEAPDTADIVLLWATAIAKVVGGVIPLVLGFGLAPTIPRRLLVTLCWIGGAFYTLYGLGDIVGGAIQNANGAEHAIWYVLIWGPIWLGGGLLHLAVAWLWHTRQR